MARYTLPILYTVFVWWFSTGVILYLNGLPRWTYKWTMGAASGLLALALVGIHVLRDDTRISGVYLSFTCALMVWAWQEIAFLLGFVTGPRRTPCPADARGWQRAGLALQTLLHHEFALLALGAAVITLAWGGSNPTAILTFAILWVMRQSAKLNVFFGVRNLNESFLPNHLRYLESYFRRRPMNSLFPVSVIGSTWIAWLMWESALADRVSGFDATLLTFAGSLMTLAILEHWFLVLPLPSEALWRWGLRSRASPAGDGVSERS
ncbi:MAG: DUF3623 domain-containing protein [Gammaproteobacteria bacterium]|nr:DUF3623 domain-containing protein [Gammaproteobacteria bacterium]MBU1442841.1 DUF3623 domain-containing protein [Gammaproteobacteria bacterium]